MTDDRAVLLAELLRLRTDLIAAEDELAGAVAEVHPCNRPSARNLIHAHVPAIWATQVLESLAKEGLPSRAEITDAAMGNRVECVMLNKGPHVVRAVGALDDILHRMQAHSTKKRSMLRQLALARAFMESARGSARSPAETGDEEPALSVATE
jgi:pyruvate kinase